MAHVPVFACTIALVIVAAAAIVAAAPSPAPLTSSPSLLAGTHVCLLVPSRMTHKRVPANVSLEHSPFFNILVPSLARTISVPVPSGWRWTVYLGHDTDDSYYERQLSAVYSLFARLTPRQEKALALLVVQLHNADRTACYAWNFLARRAFADGCDYLMAMNDDMRFETKAVVAPKAEYDLKPRCLTTSLVHRTHVEAFGFYFPPIFRNWYSDDWIGNVYPLNNTLVLDGTERKPFVRIAHRRPFGAAGRYTVDATGRHVLRQELRAARAHLATWATTFGASCAPRYSPTDDVIEVPPPSRIVGGGDGGRRRPHRPK